jgi:nucleotide sugar dehydrogenase
MSTAMTWKEADVDTVEKRQKHVVSVIGCERAGLISACLFANVGFKVISVDSNPYIINLLKKGKIPSGDPDLAKLIKPHVKTGRITATNQVKEATSTSDIVIFAVPPSLDQKKKPDYSNIEKACKEIGMGLRTGSLVIVESSLGPGVTETLLKETLEKSSGLKAGTHFGLAYIPIDAWSWRASQDVATHSRVVGALNEQSLKVAYLILKQISNTEIITVTNMKTAEAVNLFKNVCCDVNHGLANELAFFCEKAGIDFFESQRALSTQTSCILPFPDVLSGYALTDPYLFFEEAENLNVEPHLMAAARKINIEMLNHTLRLTREALKSCDKTLRRARVSIFGVSRRPDVKELDQSFVKHLVTALVRNGARVCVYDSLISHKKLTELDYPVEKTLRKAVEGADCLIFTVGRDRFKRLSLRGIKFLVKKPAAIVDLAHAFDPNDARKEGFAYRGLGRG